MNYNNLAYHPGPISPPDRDASSATLSAPTCNNQSWNYRSPCTSSATFISLSIFSQGRDRWRQNEKRDKTKKLVFMSYSLRMRRAGISVFMETSVRRSWTFLRLCLRKKYSRGRGVSLGSFFHSAAPWTTQLLHLLFCFIELVLNLKLMFCGRFPEITKSVELPCYGIPFSTRDNPSYKTSCYYGCR